MLHYLHKYRLELGGGVSCHNAAKQRRGISSNVTGHYIDGVGGQNGNYFRYVHFE